MFGRNPPTRYFLPYKSTQPTHLYSSRIAYCNAIQTPSSSSIPSKSNPTNLAVTTNVGRHAHHTTPHMAGTTAAVTAVVSKLDALLPQEVEEEEQQQHRNVVPRGARRAAASIRTDLVGALSFVSKVSADEDRADLCWQLAHGGIRQQVDRAVRVLEELLWEMDMDDPTPGPGRTTTAAAQASGHRARSRALRELCHGHGYGYSVAAGDSSLDASTSAAATRAPGYCARTLRELCYDTEDFLDDFLLALPVDRTMKQKRPPAPTTRGRGRRSCSRVSGTRGPWQRRPAVSTGSSPTSSSSRRRPPSGSLLTGCSILAAPERKR